MKRYVSLFIISFLFVFPDVLNAQYFGRNKVKYETFNFQVLETDHFEIYHYPREFRAIKNLGQMAERWYGRHSNTFAHKLKFKNPLVIYANHADFQQTNVIRSQLSVATGGVTEGRRNRVVMPFAETNSSTNHVLGHELVHAFQYDVARQSQVGSIRATSKLPLWFIEGMAEYLSVGSRDIHTAMWMRDAVLQDDVPTIKEVAKSGEYFPYRYGHSIWSFITGKWGDKIINPLYKKSLRFGLEKSFTKVLGISMDSVSTLWRQSIKHRYEPMVKQRNDPSKVGKKLLAPENKSGRRNLSPSLSPDGEYVAYISDRELFSLELFLADAETGKVKKKLTSTLTSPHLNALRFIQSSGTWGPEGKKFAHVVFAKGDNQVAIIDIKSGQTTKRISFDQIGSITNPAWSPDGTKLAFSGSVGGYSNLYIYNFDTDSLRQLTHDKYSDMQPSWSPSGNRLAFVSDRGKGTDFEKLTFGNMNVCIYDMNSGSIDIIDGFEGYKHINPQFGTEGDNLYFISDYEGFSNVYRYDLATHQYYRVTNVNTGVSGISNYSPALSVARKTGDMIVTVFDNQKYIGYKINKEKTQGAPIQEGPTDVRSGRLPPLDKGNQIVRDYLLSTVAPTTSDTAFSLHDYKSKLKLTYLGGRGRVGVSSNQYETRASGGINARFSDVLNYHTMFVSLRSRGTFKDIGGQIGYLNKKQRIQWGGSVSHMPFKTSRAFAQRDTIQNNGNVIPVRQINRITRRIFQERLNLQTIYPFSRNLRLEANLNYSHIWSDVELQTSTIVGNRVVRRETKSLTSPDPANLFGGSIGLIGDNSVSGFTGPIKGHRFRFEVEPTFGSLDFTSVTADYRRYFYLDPFTLAFRGMHLGRYFGGSESNRLTPYFLGFERLIRGYNLASIGPATCQRATNKSGECFNLNSLSGSRIGVFNMEFRIPMLGVEPLALFETRLFPTTVSAFFDGGVAWTSENLPEIKWDTDPTQRVPVFSAGISARVNIMGYLITEFYVAYPFQKYNKRPYFGFHFSPGW